MGIFQTKIDQLLCPHCLSLTQIDLQIKGFYSWMETLEVGDRLYGGPFLDGEYGIIKNTCSSCYNEFYPVCIVKDQVIVDLDAYLERDLDSLPGSYHSDFLVPYNYSREQIIEYTQLPCLFLMNVLGDDDLEVLENGVDWNRASYLLRLILAMRWLGFITTFYAFMTYLIHF